VSGSSQVIGILSSLNTYTGSNDTTNTAQNSRLTSIESVTGSYEIKGRNIVSGSSQITLSSTTGYGSVLNQAVLTTSAPAFAGITIGGSSSTFPVNVYTSSANTFGTIAEFYNGDYTAGTRTFIRVRNAVNAGGTYSSYFGQGQDGKTYIIANNSARGGDIIIDGNDGNVTINSTITSNNYIKGTCTTSFNGDGVRVYASATGGPGSQPGIGFWTAAGSKRFITQLDVSTDTWGVVNASGTNLISTTQSGNSTFSGTITENSSLRYKENVETIKYGLDKVLQMRGVTYDKKNTRVTEIGVIAEEIYEVLPELVLKNEEGEIDSVSYGRITAVLIEAIKEQQKQIEELKALIK
jgi:hypothetical protein